MADSFIISGNENKESFLLEAGTYQAVCVGVIDLGEQYSAAFDSTSRKVLIQFEIPAENYTDNEGVAHARIQSATYTASLGAKANLRKVLEAWRGKPFTEEELKGFDLKHILGVGCMINIIHKQSKEGKEFASISSVMKLPKGTPSPETLTKPVLFAIDEDTKEEEINIFPEWIANRIKESETWKKLCDMRANTFQDISEEDIPFK